MGRGRQKAKHTKVARDLKYFSPDTNYGALQKELGTSGEPGDPRLDEDLAAWPEYVAGSAAPSAEVDDDDDDDEDDEYVPGSYQAEDDDARHSA
ncbi:hypothetical protein ABIE21_003453 [Conyzicola nivalis]|uniref:DUF3073 domain-containing protein n=1 Tax=Conyzicola nivalis TaxID=1477021 RepID=A0ABV2QS79_9MICO